MTRFPLPPHFALESRRETLDEPPLVLFSVTPAIAFRLTPRQAADLGHALIEEAERARGFDPSTGLKRQP